MGLTTHRMHKNTSASFSKSIFLLALVSAIYSCVPVKQQLIVKDPTKKTLKQLRKVDTLLQYPDYTYKLKEKDILSFQIVTLERGEYDLQQLSNQGNVSAMGGRNMQNMGAQNGGAGYIINDSGYVLLPLVGKIYAKGLTITECEAKVQAEMDKLLANTTVRLRMLNFIVYLTGEVLNAGPIIAPGDRITLLELIAMSGGFTDFSDRKNIKIVRNIENSAHIYYVDLSNQNLLTQPRIYLLPNDIVIVEPLRAKVVKAYTIPNITLGISSFTLLLTLYLTLGRFLQ